MKKSVLIFASFLTFIACITTKPNLTPVQKRQITTRQFECDKKTAFYAVLSVMMDVFDYDTILRKDLEAGILVLQKTKSQSSVFGYFVNRDEEVVYNYIDTVNIIIEPVGKKYVNIRIKIKRTTKKNSVIENVDVVYDAQLYSKIFSAIKHEIAVRKSKNL